MRSVQAACRLGGARRVKVETVERVCRKVLGTDPRELYGEAFVGAWQHRGKRVDARVQALTTAFLHDQEREAWRDGKVSNAGVPPGRSTRNAASAGSRATGRCRRWSLRSPVTSKLFHRHGMLHESHERTNGRPTAQWPRLEAGRSG